MGKVCALHGDRISMVVALHQDCSTQLLASLIGLHDSGAPTLGREGDQVGPSKGVTVEFRNDLVKVAHRPFQIVAGLCDIILGRFHLFRCVWSQEVQLVGEYLDEEFPPPSRNCPLRERSITDRQVQDGKERLRERSIKALLRTGKASSSRLNHMPGASRNLDENLHQHRENSPRQSICRSMNRRAKPRETGFLRFTPRQCLTLTTTKGALYCTEVCTDERNDLIIFAC